MQSTTPRRITSRKTSGGIQIRSRSPKSLQPEIIWHAMFSTVLKSFFKLADDLTLKSQPKLVASQLSDL
jgi:hypothetical protein